MNFKNKKVTVVGLGKSGFAAAKFLWAQKASVRVTEGSEKKEALENASYLRTLGLEVETGAHTEGFVSGSDWVITSPGVPKHSPPLQWARQKDIPVISEIELASYFCRGRIVAVTGSNGKTTTCHLIYRVLTDAGKDCVLCGNVGHSFLDALPQISSRTIVVLELSSFQLEDSPHFHPSVAVMLNLSPNHLDRHGTMENYAAAKANIHKNQTPRDMLILNADDGRIKSMAQGAHARVLFFSQRELEEGIFLSGDRIIRRQHKKDAVLLDTAHFPLRGDHNLQNIMACAAVAVRWRLPRKKIQKTLENFTTLEHRIEPVGELSGVHFVNDSKSTTVESTRAAILAMDRPVVLVAGGRDKGVLFSHLEDVLKKKVRSAVLYGEARGTIAGAWKEFGPVKTEENFEKAVRLAFEEAKPGDCLLLSPMCTSFDQFFSFEQRGEMFKRLFRTLCAEKEGPSCRP